MTHKVLIIEDVDTLRNALTLILEREGYIVRACESGEEALHDFEAGSYDCIVSDFKLAGIDGLQILERIRAIDSRVPLFLMTAFATIDLAVHAMKYGATDFITKPFEPELFLESIKQGISHRKIHDKELGLNTKRERKLSSKSPEMLVTIEQARRVAKVESSVMIFGESGTGKELLARFIHEQSNRKDKPFIAINCAALPYNLLESEFFGHEAGAFTGATKSRVGLFEVASEGTIFLDEIGDMPKSLQVKLLRALQEREIKRIGGNKVIKVNPRVIAATNCSERMVLESERLREDLYYRLAVITFELAPLRDRPEDIEFLTTRFIEYFSGVFNRTQPTLSKAASDALLRYSWPGNIRELENVIERAVLLAKESIDTEHLGLEGVTETDQTLTESLHQIADMAARTAEIAAIAKMLKRTVGNKSKAARELGVSYKTLLHKVKEYGLENI